MPMPEMLRPTKKYTDSDIWNFCDEVNEFAVSLIDGRPQHLLGCFTILSDGFGPWLDEVFPQRPREYWEWIHHWFSKRDAEPNERVIAYEIKSRMFPINIDPDAPHPIPIDGLSEDEVVDLYLSEAPPGMSAMMLGIIKEVAQKRYREEHGLTV